ncbi:MAG: hypothetical protein RLZZ628_3962 [Bacteroidota bacterium]|jgi:hypothetical protein
MIFVFAQITFFCRKYLYLYHSIALNLHHCFANCIFAKRIS